MRCSTFIEILLVACSNEDGFHDDKEYFLCSLMVLGELVINSPTREQAQEVLQKYPNNPILMLVTPCKACRAKGIASQPYFLTIERE